MREAPRSLCAHWLATMSLALWSALLASASAAFAQDFVAFATGARRATFAPKANADDGAVDGARLMEDPRDGAVLDRLAWNASRQRRSNPHPPFGLRLIADERPAEQLLREAKQAPDIFHTPNPTPLERDPAHSPDSHHPKITPGQILPGPESPTCPPPAPMPPLAPLVNVRFTDTWLPAAKEDLGMNDFDVKGTLALGTTGVMLTPGYGMHFLNGPTRTDLPETLYDVYLDTRWSKKLDDCWAVELAITPSFYGDLDNNSSDAWRFIGTGIVYYTLSGNTQLMGGLMYLDRFDINWFPLVGVITSGRDGYGDYRYEFVFPRPKFARCVSKLAHKEGWAYVAGEFGGGAWAIQRQTGEDDTVAIRDWRAVLGYEAKVKDYSMPSWYGEVGWVFNRQVEYASGRGDFDPAGCGMFRLGLWY